MLLNTHRFNTSRHNISKRCLVVFGGVYYKNTNNIHNIPYTKHLNTYIRVSHGTIIHTNTIKFNIFPCSICSKKVFRCLASLLILKQPNTTKHPTSAATELKVFSDLDSIVVV